MSVNIDSAPAIAGKSGAHTHDLRGWKRQMSRVHAALYGLHLGWLVGSDFMLITHRGRKTGQLRQTLVLIVGRDPASQETVVAARDSSADWYRNIQASPCSEVQIGTKKYRPEQRFLSANELADVLVRHRREHPIRSRIQRFLLDWPSDSTRGELLALAGSLGVKRAKLSPGAKYLDKGRLKMREVFSPNSPDTAFGMVCVSRRPAMPARVRSLENLLAGAPK